MKNFFDFIFSDAFRICFFFIFSLANLAYLTAKIITYKNDNQQIKQTNK